MCAIITANSQVSTAQVSSPNHLWTLVHQPPMLQIVHNQAPSFPRFSTVPNAPTKSPINISIDIRNSLSFLLINTTFTNISLHTDDHIQFNYTSNGGDFLQYCWTNNILYLLNDIESLERCKVSDFSHQKANRSGLDGPTLANSIYFQGPLGNIEETDLYPDAHKDTMKPPNPQCTLPDCSKPNTFNYPLPRVLCHGPYLTGINGTLSYHDAVIPVVFTDLSFNDSSSATVFHFEADSASNPFGIKILCNKYTCTELPPLKFLNATVDGGKSHYHRQDEVFVHPPLYVIQVSNFNLTTLTGSMIKCAQ